MNDLDPRSALVVFSGGQDSTTCLGWALMNYAKVRCVTFDYNQRHACELEAAINVIEFFQDKTKRDIPHEIVEIGPIFAGMSPLTNDTEKLETYANHDEMEAIIGDRIEKTFVPMRNAVFLMLAANRAAVAQCGAIITGVCQADNANYPDCRSSFIGSARRTINLALGTDLHELSENAYMSLVTPLMSLSKAQSINLAMSLPNTYAALQYSHTAYSGEYPPTTKDHASVLRAHGFEEANVPDPLVLRAWREELMELPKSANYAPSIIKGVDDQFGLGVH